MRVFISNPVAMKVSRYLILIGGVLTGSLSWSLTYVTADHEPEDEEASTLRCGGPEEPAAPTLPEGLFGGGGGGFGGGAGCEGWNACPCEEACQQQQIAECRL